jgi:hypothetical protein
MIRRTALMMTIVLAWVAPLRSEPAEVGVPTVAIDYDAGVRDWWAVHPFNPASPNHRSAIRSPKPVVKLQDGDSIQEAIAFLPHTGGTIKLAPGRYRPFRIIGRSHIHILGPEQGEAVIVGQSRIAVAVEALDYGYWNQMTATRPEPLKWHWQNERMWKRHLEPVRDFYFRNLIFDGLNQSARQWVSQSRLRPPSANPSGWDQVAMVIQRAFDVVFDDCVFRNYANARQGHPGLVSGHMGLNNIWFRGCHFVGDSVFVTYLDGAHGCGHIDCTIEGKGFSGPGLLYLTNHDYTYDLNENGRIERNEERNAKYVVMSGCRINGRLPGVMTITGEQILLEKTTCTGDVGYLMRVDPPGPIAHGSYRHGEVGARLIDNTVAGRVHGALLIQRVFAARAAKAKALPADARYTLEGNTVKGNDPPKVKLETVGGH